MDIAVTTERTLTHELCPLYTAEILTPRRFRTREAHGEPRGPTARPALTAAWATVAKQESD